MAEFTGYYSGLFKDWSDDCWKITFTINEQEALEHLAGLKYMDRLRIKAEKWHKKRSLDANALMWKCISQIAAVENVDKWDVYLDMLKSYGTCSPVTINAEAYDSFVKNWREVEVVGRFTADGVEKISLLCYFGSSLLDSKEFGRLLDGIKWEMELLGLQPPASQEMQRTLKEWEESHQ